LEILEDDEYYDIGTSSIIDLSSEFKGGMYSWFEKDWDNLKKRFMKLLT
ncbi:15162_t:CDS:1, partial [Rhizophagus irregularis]